MVTAKISAVPLVSVGSAAAAHGASAATTSAVAAMDHCRVECVMARGDPGGVRVWPGRHRVQEGRPRNNN